ncbi:hypothetical protein WJX73_009019 [Symbiochloris irregularis]|uniref:SET domain-containing protein n=1 Tax=Symbiochloris irregularis TaxID=706552 RepID=A0AAW1PIT4_9CHLO
MPGTAPCSGLHTSPSKQPCRHIQAQFQRAIGSCHRLFRASQSGAAQRGRGLSPALSRGRQRDPCRLRATQEAASAVQTPLQGLLQWAVDNGVRGIGQADSKVAIYETDQEERGMLAVQEVAEDEVLFSVPLRLALTDATSKHDGLKGGTWLSRLAAQVLERKTAATSPWQPYIQALPHAADPQPFLPSSEAVLESGVPLGQLSPTLIPRLRTVEDLLPGITAQLREFSPQEVQWAMQLVQSRACGTMDKQGEPVRMLVPLMDMLNHQGDESELLPSQPVTVRENARWDLVQHDGQWEMQVSAMRPLEAGEEVSLSYEERENEYFLVQYGFVPMSNVHDAVQLFSSTDAAEAWCKHHQAGRVPSLYEEPQQMAQLQPSGLPLEQQHQVPILQLHTGARMDPDLVAVFEASSSRTPAHSASQELSEKGRQLALARCWEVLQEGVDPLLRDLAMLAADQGSDDSEAEVWVRRLQHYRQVVAAACQKAGSQSLAAPAQQQTASNLLKQGQLSPSARLILRFVALKKCVLWDAVTQLLAA